MKTIITRTPAILLTFILGVMVSGVFAPAAMAATGPDLIVEEISTYPELPVLGEQATIRIVVKNQGETAAATTFVTCSIDNIVLDTKQTAALEPGITDTIAFFWTATAGVHTVKATADDTRTLTETDETNNTSTITLTTLAPDLVVESITWSPANPSRGDSTNISITILNQGTYRSKYSNFDFLIDDASRGITEITSIDPGKSLTKTVVWLALAGEHTFTAVVDKADSTKESDETNNRFSVAFNTMAPDLAVESITWTPEPPSQGDSVTVSITVVNLGAGRADTSNLAYSIDGVFLDTIQIPALDGGDSHTATFTWSAIPGTHNIHLAADYYNGVNESNEANNELESVLITQAPDLVIRDLSWLPLEVTTGDEVTFTATLKNQGGGKAAGSRSIFYIDNEIIGYLDFSSLDAGEDDTATLTWIAEGGDHYISLISDVLGKNTESDESNNRYDTNLTVALPDLIVSDITFFPEKPDLDEMVTITITVKNRGQGASPSSRIALSLDGNQETVSMMKPLESDESADIVYQCKIRSGHHVFEAQADFDNAIREADEKNNNRAANIAPNLADIAITNVTWSPQDIIPGEEITFSIDIENIGGLNAGISRIVFYTDDMLASYYDLDPIKAGEKITRTFKWVASEGRHTVNITADSKGQIEEIDESNNNFTISIPPPDLTVQAISISPQIYVTGDTVTITARITNLKGNDTPVSTATIYIDDSSAGNKEVPPLATGEDYEFFFEWTALAGTHTFMIAADTGNTVTETNEMNNEAQAVSSTNMPDLVIDSINWKINGQLDSNEVTFTILMSNAGTCESGKFSLKYSFDNGVETIKQIDSIPGNGKAELVFNAILSKGEHSGDIVLDINEEISETDESNNHRALTFSTIAPDLVIRSISWSPITADIGDNVTISVKIENLGFTKAVNTNVSLSIDGAKARLVNAAEIDASSTVTLEFPWRALEGEHTLNVYADASLSVAECDETNNTRERTITFAKQVSPAKSIPIVNPAATTGGGLLDTWWWVLLVVGGLLGLMMIFTTVRNMRKG